MSAETQRVFIGCALIGACLSADAALIDRGNGLIFDTDLGITWLADPNLGRGSVFDDGQSAEDGRMSLASAIAWAEWLDYGGYTDWRLPKTPLRDSGCNLDNGTVNYGFNCAANELGHLFYSEFSAVAGQPVSSSGSPYLKYFRPIDDSQSGYGYWFNSQWCCSHSPFFVFAGGELSYGGADNGYYAWAVRDGDVAAVPELSTAVLALLGWVAVVGYTCGFARRQINIRTRHSNNQSTGAFGVGRTI